MVEVPGVVGQLFSGKTPGMVEICLEIFTALNAVPQIHNVVRRPGAVPLVCQTGGWSPSFRGGDLTKGVHCLPVLFLVFMDRTFRHLGWGGSGMWTKGWHLCSLQKGRVCRVGRSIRM